MLKKVSNKCCSFEFSVHQRILKTNVLQFTQTVILNIDNNYISISE